MAATIRLVQGDDLPGVSFYIRDSNKGAAGQAVQNMNLLFGLPESEGLELVPCFP